MGGADQISKPGIRCSGIKLKDYSIKSEVERERAESPTAVKDNQPCRKKADNDTRDIGEELSCLCV